MPSYLRRYEHPDRQHSAAARVGPADQPGHPVAEHVQHPGRLAGNVGLHALNQACRVERGEDSGGGRLVPNCQEMENTGNLALSRRCWPMLFRLLCLSISFGQGDTLEMQSSTPSVMPLMVRELPIPFHSTAPPCHRLRFTKTGRRVSGVVWFLI